MPPLSQAPPYRFASESHVRAIQKHHVKWFVDGNAKRVLDVGCGRGLFLELLREAGIDAVGIDGNAAAVARSAAAGFAVEHGDALALLDTAHASGRRFDGVFLSHLVEHFEAAAAEHLLASCAALLAPGGRLVVITPNIESPLVWNRSFWLDPTHVRPYPRPLLEALLADAGLRLLASFDDPATAPRAGRFTPLADLRDVVRYGASAMRGMDAVVVAERPSRDREP